MSLVLRNVKGSPLTYTEMDDNLTYLEGLSTTGNTLANTLSIGNETDGNNIKLSDGDRIFNDDGADLISGLELDPGNINNGTRFYTEDINTSDKSEIYIGSNYSYFESINFPNDIRSILELDPSGFGVTRLSKENYNTNLQSGIYVLDADSLYIESNDSVNSIRLSLKPTIFNLSGLPIYANNAAALLGGLTVDDVYKTSTGELRIVV